MKIIKKINVFPDSEKKKYIGTILKTIISRKKMHALKLSEFINLGLYFIYYLLYYMQNEGDF